MGESDPSASSMRAVSFGENKTKQKTFARGREGPPFCLGSLVRWVHEHSWLKAPVRFGSRQAQLEVHPSGVGRHLRDLPGLWGEVQEGQPHDQRHWLVLRVFQSVLPGSVLQEAALEPQGVHEELEVPAGPGADGGEDDGLLHHWPDVGPQQLPGRGLQSHQCRPFIR